MEIAAEAKNAAKLTEMEIERLRIELRWSLDWETDVWAKARKSMKAIQYKLDSKIKAHK